MRFDEKKERNEEEKEKKELSESRERDKKKIFRVYKIPRPRRPPVLALALASLHIADISALRENKKERTRTKEQSLARAHIYILFRADWSI